MNIKRQTLIAIVILATSCSNNSIYKIGKRTVCQTENVEVQKLAPVDSICGRCTEAVWGIHCICDTIAILDLRSLHPYCYRALNLKNNEYLDFLLKGRGPNEMIMSYFSQCRQENDTTYIDVSGMNEYIFVTINLNETIKRGHVVVSNTVNVPRSVSSSYIMGDNIVSESPFDLKYSFMISKSNDMADCEKIYPYGEDEIVALHQPLFNSTKKVKPDGSLLSMSMFYFDEVNIFDIKGKRNISISTSKVADDMNILQEAVSTKSESYYYYFHHDVTDNNIYALYYNCSAKSYRERQSSTIHVFSWEGKLKRIINVDELLIGLAVSSDDSIMYGLTGREELYKYNLQ